MINFEESVLYQIDFDSNTRLIASSSNLIRGVHCINIFNSIICIPNFYSDWLVLISLVCNLEFMKCLYYYLCMV